MVEDWGTGKADGSTGFVGISERWSLAISVDLGAGVSVLAPVYTVPKGKRLVVGFAKGACNASFIQEARLYRDSNIICWFWFDLNFICPVGASSAYYYEEDEVMSFYLNNTDAADHNYSVTLLGYLEDL